MPYIEAENFFALGAVILGLAWFGTWADTNAIGRKTSGVLWVIVGGLALSNLGFIPLSAPLYDFVGGYLVPLGIPLLLYKADLRRIFKESGIVLIIFFFAGVATCIGTISGFFLFNLGEGGAQVAGAFTGGWIGGAMNYVAVSKAVEMPAELSAAALSASSPVSIMALMTLLALPSIPFIRRMVPSTVIDETATPSGDDVAGSEKSHFLLHHVTGAVALSFIICAISYAIASELGYEQFSILFVTIVAVAFANIFPKTLSKLEGDFDIGVFIMYIFFAVIGASTSATQFLESALILFVYGCFIIITHLIVIIGVAKFLKFDLAETIVASGAAIVGPAATAAIATSKGWKDLVTPAIMCGIFGYAVANFIGVAVTTMLK